MGYTWTLTLSTRDMELVVDALNKGAARHDSYARFYPGRQQEKHSEMATGMRRIIERINRLVRD